MKLGSIFLMAALAAGPVAAETPPPPPALPGTPGAPGMPEAPPAKAPDKPPERPPEKSPDKPASDAVWTKTKVIVCEVLVVRHCRFGGCEPAGKLPSFRVDLGGQMMCGLVGGSCRNLLKIGQVGLDRSGTRLTVHALGVAFVVGVDADGTMNGADVVKGRVVAIQGRCVPG
jgi:hypothetical protein